MYLKNLAIRNIGPIDKLSINMPFNENGNPIPVIFVGENGTGKTILLSQVVDSLYEFANKLFNDVLPKDGLGYKFYKISGGINLKIGREMGFALTSFIDGDNKFEYFDKIGDVKKENFKELLPDFLLSPNGVRDNQKITTNISEIQIEQLRQEFLSGAYFFQPAYRYEEPFWKNDYFASDTSFQETKRFNRTLGKEIEIITSTKNNKIFLLDLVLDFSVNQTNFLDKITWSQINAVLQEIKQRKDIRFSIGSRGGYRVGIVEQNPDGSFKKQLLPSIDTLSLGESILLNIFINIIRYSNNLPKDFNDIKGIVVIDEIDVHLHTSLQGSVLPRLIKLFPKVQFIITTHSPFLLLGMKNIFGESNFEIINMPSGEIITTERFSEFQVAYDILKETEQFVSNVSQQVNSSIKPVIFVEGDYDIRYIKRAAELLGEVDLLEKVQISDGGGFGNLDKIFRNFDEKLADILPQKVLLLYDCDTQKTETSKGKMTKKVVPTVEKNLVKKGIENLFPIDTIRKAKDYKNAFIDYTPEFKREVRGNKIIENEKYEINKDEKNNLCAWLCENGNIDDFKNFESIFYIIKEFLSQ